MLNFVVDCTYDFVVTAQEVRRLTRSIENCWEEFASELDADLFTVSKVEEIARQRDGLFMQARTMLETWKDHHATKAYRRFLIQALIEMDRRKEANDVFGEGVVKRVLKLSRETVDRHTGK